MKKILLCIISWIPTLGFSQTLNSGVDSTLIGDINYRNHFFTIGPLFNISESLIGIQIGNGNDEQPLIHFEDLSADILYKLSGQTDFKK